MALTGDSFDLVQGGVVTSSAQIVDDGATVGDVLTVQADKSIAAAPGGGSQPGAVVITPVTILYSDMMDTGDGYRFAPMVDLAAGDVLLWAVGFVTVAFNDSNAATTQIQLVDSTNALAWGATQGPTVDTPVDETAGYLNLGDGAFDDTPPTTATSQVGPVRIAAPVIIGITDNGSLAGDGSAGTVLAYYSKASQ